MFMDPSISISSINHDHAFEIDNFGLQYFIGDPIGIHDQPEAELGGFGPESDGRLAKRSRKIFRGLILMVIIAFAWVATIHLLRMSFHTERVLLAISPIANNFNLSQHRQRKILQLQSPATNLSASLPKGVLTTATTPGPPGSFRNLHNSPINRSYGSDDFPRSKFDAPYFVTWYFTLWNILYLPVYLIIHSCCLSRRSKTVSDSASESVGSSYVSDNGAFGSKSNSTKGSTNSDDNNPSSIRKVFEESIQGLMEKGFTMVQFFYRCAFFCTLCTLANYMLIFSLRILDATVVMALLSCTVSIVYLLSWVVLHQQFVGIRIVAAIICDTGIALLVYMDGVQHRTSATVMISFGSAIVFGVYKVFMRRMIGYTTFAQMALFHTLVGLLNALLAWPIVLLLYVTGIETIIWSEIPWSYLTGAAACAFFANVIASFGVICTYEVLLTLGLFFAIPISSVIDIYINSAVFRDMKLGGILLISTGFLVVLLPENWNRYLTNIFRNRLAKWKRREELKKNGGRVQDTSTGQLSRLRTSSGRVK